MCDDFMLVVVLETYIFDNPAGSDAVIEAHPTSIFIVLPWTDDVLVPGEVVPLIQNPPAAIYLQRVTTSDVPMKVNGVALTFIGLPLKVLVLKKHNLKRKELEMSYSKNHLIYSQCVFYLRHQCSLKNYNQELVHNSLYMPGTKKTNCRVSSACNRSYNSNIHLESPHCSYSLNCLFVHNGCLAVPRI